MACSVRVISVLDQTYTLEFELEVEDPKELITELAKTKLGLKLVTLLERMLPDVQQAPLTEIAKAEEREREALKEEGRKEIRDEMSELKEAHKEEVDALKKELEATKEKYRAYIHDKWNPAEEKSKKKVSDQSHSEVQESESPEKRSIRMARRMVDLDPLE